MTVIHNRLASSRSLALVRALLVSCGATLGSACALEFNSHSLGVPVSMTPVSGTAASDTFNVTLHAVYIFWGLAEVKEPSLQPVLAGQLGNGGAVADLSISARKKWSDVLVTAFTLGFISPTTVTYRGVIVRGSP
jgi:hypothetical protein